MPVTSGAQATSSTRALLIQGFDAAQNSSVDTGRPVSGYVRANTANSASVFLGGSAVTVGNGFELPAGTTSPRFDLWTDDDALYVVSAAAQGVTWISITAV